MKRIGITLLILCSLCACKQQHEGLNIAVASNFESTLKQIIKHYRLTNPDQQINIIAGSSGVLSNQILNNAPYDLFLSADSSKTDEIYRQQKLTHKPKIYAIGQLALWIPTQDLTQDQGHECLKHLQSIETLAVANPKTAPYGAMAAKIIEKYNIKVDKILELSNATQAYLYTQDNLAQAGFVAKSMLPASSRGCIQIFTDASLSQSMLLLNDDASQLFQFILSKKMQTLIKNSGYNTLN
ncbi:MAG TPA: molybdate ABC transporter substrate-binding protein [Oceanospirillales bacterium]|nr:molybdate ABC transporter substrate-binding protein [Oceanospirillales bacterium]